MTAVDILIHAGLHKTGTTWLQQRVFSERDGKEIAYCGDIDLLYRTFITPAASRFSAADAREGFAPLLDRAEKHKQLAVMSGEGLAGRPFHAKYYRQHTVRRLAEAFPEARILLTIREQRAIIYSMYGQYLRFGYTASLTEFLRAVPEGSSHHPILEREFYDYMLLLQDFEQVFPADRICILPFEWLLDQPQAAIDRLAGFTGHKLAPIAAATTRQSSNPAWSDLAYSALRHLNRFHSQDARWQHKRRFPPPNAIAHQVNRLTPDALRDRMRQRNKALIEREIGDVYAASNARLAERIGIDLGRYGYSIG